MLTKNRHALEVIEAAATLPVMLLILVALVNLGFAVYARQAVQNAAAYGARMGAVAQDCRSCAAYSAASSALSGTLVRNASVQILAPGGSVGSVLRVRVTGEVPNLMGPLMALNGGGMAGPIIVWAEATFRAEGW
jgi:Flp pilus assembly protein TadG